MTVAVSFQCHIDSDTRGKKKAAYFTQFMGHRLMIAMADAQIRYKLMHNGKTLMQRKPKVIISTAHVTEYLYALRALGK
jgi:hypothetical protein